MGERAKLITRTPETNKVKSVSNLRKTDFCQSISSPYDHIMFLQRTIGNQAVQRLLKGTGFRVQRAGVRIQPKLKIGLPNDVYEQEADRVADTVMRMPEPAIQTKPG